MAMKSRATIVDGELVLMSPTGGMPGRAAGAIYLGLRQYEGKAPGWAYPDNIRFIVDLPNRGSFSPDAAFYTGQPPGMKFLQRAPAFAAMDRREELARE